MVGDYTQVERPELIGQPSAKVYAIFDESFTFVSVDFIQRVHDSVRVRLGEFVNVIRPLLRHVLVFLSEVTEAHFHTNERIRVNITPQTVFNDRVFNRPLSVRNRIAVRIKMTIHFCHLDRKRT